MTYWRATMFGLLALMSVAVMTVPTTGKVTTTVCPPKTSYTAYPDVTFTSLTGLAGLASGSRPTVDEAIEFCRYEPRCTYFNTLGDYALGAVGASVPHPGVCSYIKNACPPLDGFVAYADVDVNNNVVPYKTQLSTNCFLDVFKACANDRNCLAFNKQRYVWQGNTAAAMTTLTGNLFTMPGSCVYVKNLTVTHAGCADSGTALAVSNAYRALHGSRALTWSNGLATSSQAWAEGLAANGCSLSHGSTGENLYAAYSSHVISTRSCSAAVESWYSEISQYRFTSTPWTDNQAHFGAIGHFTQVVWAQSKHFGCGAASSADGKCYVVACRYTPPGNIATDKHFFDYVKPAATP